MFSNLYAGGLSLLSVIRKLEKDIEFTYDKKRADMAKKQIKLIHRDDDGFIAIAAERNRSFLQYHYKVDTLVQNIKKTLNIDANIYITANSFFKPTRTIESIRKLNALYIDLDYYKIEKYKDYTGEEMLEVLNENYFRKDILPKPTLVTFTGRGLGIYWAIENLPYMALPLWNTVQKYILGKLKPIGADPVSIDASRLLRLSGTVNLKSNKNTYIIYSNKTVYNLRDIQKEYLPVLSKKKTKVKKISTSKEVRIINIYNLHNLHFARLNDLIKLVEMRHGFCRNSNGVLVQKGSREKMVFLYRYWSCCYTADPKAALESTLEFNSKFNLPLKESEVIEASKSAEKAYEAWLEHQNKKKNKLNDKVEKEAETKFDGYNYRNKTLIAMLNITEEEMQELSTIITLEEKRRRDKANRWNKRRDEEGLTAKQRELKELKKKVKKLREEGYSIRMIGKKLGISASKVQRSIKD